MKAKYLDKRVKSELDNLAEKLPEIPLAERKELIGSEILSNPKYSNLRSKETISPFKKYTVREAGYMERVNHKKRLVKCFIEGGWNAVEAYVKPFIQLESTAPEP